MEGQGISQSAKQAGGNQLNEELSRKAAQLETVLARLQRDNKVLMESINPQCMHPCQGYPVDRPAWIQGHKLERI
jgi:hypothetical protein